MNPIQTIQPLEAPTQERVIFKIKRHPIGILAVYFTSAVLLIILAVVAFGVAPRYFTSTSSSQVYGIAGVAYAVFFMLVSGFVYVAHIVYWDNSWTLSDESLAQVTRSSLFDKQSSHLSLGNLQDVIASQEGILPHLFHFGSLRVETAGESSRFLFPLCPNPNLYAQHILEAREQFEQKLRSRNDGLQSSAYTNQYQPPQPPAMQQAPISNEPQSYPIPPQPPTSPSDYTS